MNNMSTPKWDVEVYSLHFGDRSLRTVYLQVCATTGPEIDISWISSATVFLFYGQALIGEATLEQALINTEDCNDVLVLEMIDFEIQDMTAFKTFVQGIMPKPQEGYQLRDDDDAFIGRLEVVEKGHKLTTTLNLHDIGSLKTTKPVVQLTGDLIEITFSVSNPTPVEIYFYDTEIHLQKNEEVLATLSGKFEIVSSNEESPSNYSFKGQILPSLRRELFGKAILIGHRVKDNIMSQGGNNTWLIHALRELKIEVDLDEMILCKLE